MPRQRSTDQNTDALAVLAQSEELLRVSRERRDDVAGMASDTRLAAAETRALVQSSKECVARSIRLLQICRAVGGKGPRRSA